MVKHFWMTGTWVAVPAGDRAEVLTVILLGSPIDVVLKGETLNVVLLGKDLTVRIA